jgi:ABC-2 type transport system permease protein
MGFNETVQTVRSSMFVALRNRFATIPVWLWFLQIILTSFFTMYFFAVIADYVRNPDVTVQYVVIGNAVQSIAMTTLYSVSEIPGVEKHTGTLPTLMSTPSKMFDIFLGMAMFNILAGIVSSTFSLFASSLVFNVDFSSANILSIVTVMLLTILSLTGMGMMIGSIGIRLRTSSIIANVVTYLGLVLCGINFPVSSLPGWLQAVSYCHPLTYAVDATRKAVEGASLVDISGQILMMVVLGAIFLLLSYAMFSFFERKARKTGSYDTF